MDIKFGEYNRHNFLALKEEVKELSQIITKLTAQLLIQGIEDGSKGANSLSGTDTGTKAGTGKAARGKRAAKAA